VKEGYAEIGLMRELGMTWAEIAELLGRNGAVTRGGKVFTAATVRAAFFLVGAEIRQGQHNEAAVQSGGADGVPGNDGGAGQAGPDSGAAVVAPTAAVPAADALIEAADAGAASGPVAVVPTRTPGGQPLTDWYREDMLLLTPARSRSVAWLDGDPTARLPAGEPDQRGAVPTPAATAPTVPAGTTASAPRGVLRSVSGRFTPEGAMSWDWTQRVDSST
jgi:hypothetical protein